MLLQHEVYRRIKPVDIGPVLQAMEKLKFVDVYKGSTDPKRYGCLVVFQSAFPPPLLAFAEGLELGGGLARAILRKLGPRQSIPPHVDQWMPDEADWRRFQVPLVSHPAIVMRWPDDGVAVHLAPGWLYEVRFDRLHEVVNEADVERIHLQIDQVDATI